MLYIGITLIFDLCIKLNNIIMLTRKLIPHVIGIIIILQSLYIKIVLYVKKAFGMSTNQ